MSRFPFPDQPAPDAADGEPIEYALRRWVLAHGGSPRLAELAGWVRRAEAQGDSCLALSGADSGRHGAPRLEPDALAALAEEALVGNGSAPTPFVLDRSARLYFHRNWRNEQRIVEQLLPRLRPRSDAPICPEPLLDLLFADTDPVFSAQQRNAVRASFGHGLQVITGGPGTGKTSTVLRLLLAHARLHPQALRLRLAAPTGKAAQRLADALRQGAGRLLARSPELEPALADVMDSPPSTVHRLLGYQPHEDRFRHGLAHRLDVDLVLVDEASMLDIATLRALLDAIPPAALLVLVGDPDQLTSVGTGSALDDLVRALTRRAHPALARLQHGFRSDSRLQPLLDAVREGDSAAFAQARTVAGKRYAQDPPSALPERLDGWIDDLDRRLGPLRETRGADSAQHLLQEWQRSLLLCALRDGRHGAAGVAARIESALRRRWGVPEGDAWFAGRGVLIRRNDYGRALFNGDLGVALRETSGELRVWFAASGETGAAIRSLAPADLPDHESAAALTVHRSQGSEYGRIALLLPPDPDNPLLTRQLLYTALSRARDRIDLWARDSEFERAMQRRVARVGGLHDTLLAAI